MAKQDRTAAELLAEMSSDPDFVRRSREQEHSRAEFESALNADEKPLLSELANAEVAVQSVWDLVNTSTPYPNAIPILVKHLQGDHHERTKEGIARALTVVEARGIATKALIDEFCEIDDPNSHFKWVLGAAVAETATPDALSLVVELLSDKAHGKAREFLPLALRCLPSADGEPLLQTMMDDPDLREQAIEALKHIRKQ